MFNTLKELLSAGLSQDSQDTESSGPDGIQIAAAVLMVEISLADSQLSPEERTLLEKVLAHRFDLGPEETRHLISLAEEEVDHAVSLYEYTRLINQEFQPAQKTELLQLLWEVAYADGVLDKYEEYYIRKIADLLYVSHLNLVKTKHRAHGSPSE